MCYSARIEADYRRFVKEYGAIMSLDDFTRMIMEYFEDPKRYKLPKAMRAPFLESPVTDEEKKIAEVLRASQKVQEIELLQELSRQRERKAKAEAAIARKATKTAMEELRKATNKVAWHEGKLEELNSTEIQPRDSRIFSKWYAPVMVVKDGRRVVRPMRYLLRPAGFPASFDETNSGCYNATHEKLHTFWKGQYCHTHGVVLVDAFYEHVDRPEGDTILEFRPDPPQTLLVACLWSHWTAPGEKDLVSFAIITDPAPPEILAAGHTRCPIPIKPENIDAWLNPDPNDRDAMDAILEDKATPYYGHKVDS